MIHRVVVAGLLLLGMAGSVGAQQAPPMSAAECRSVFADADTNGDGVLSQQEIAAADLGGAQEGMTLSQFMAECQGS